MAFTPIFTNYSGMLPIMKAAKAILESDFLDALTWRAALDGVSPGENFARIQFSQMHSQKFPLCVIQPAQDLPQQITGGLQQRHIFDVEIFITRAINTGSQVDGLNALAEDLIRYYDATVAALTSADDSQWIANLPAGANIGGIRPFCTNGVFGQIQEGSARETAGQYLRSVAFELQIQMVEGQN